MGCGVVGNHKFQTSDSHIEYPPPILVINDWSLFKSVSHIASKRLFLLSIY